MDVSLSEEQGVTVLSLNGNFDTASAEAKESEIMDAIGDGSGRFLVDFSGVPYIASSGLRVLLKMAQSVRVGSGDIKLCSLNATVREVFQISGFDKILKVVGTRDEGLRAN
jgi:anti-sigma B factor antagonist